MTGPHKFWSCSKAHLSPQSAYLHRKIIVILVKISRLLTCLMQVNDPTLGEGWWDGAGVGTAGWGLGGG